MTNKTIFIFFLIPLFISCQNDPQNKIYWAIYGLPFLGLSCLVGAIVTNLFSKGKNRNENNIIQSIIIGAIIIIILYSVLSKIFLN